MQYLVQKQTHSDVIHQVDFETQQWIIGDGMVTRERELALVAYGSDCAIIAFWDDEKIGICHAGWRGLTKRIVENMLVQFQSGRCHVAPLLHEFEIKLDDCYERIRDAYGNKYFDMSPQKIIFNFQAAILERLQRIPGTFDPRSTANHAELASWRRDQKKGNGTQNRLAIWRNADGSVEHRLFLPGEHIRTVLGTPARVA